MESGINPESLKLTEDEAFALLGLCMLSPGPLVTTSSVALRKLADYCAQRGAQCNHKIDIADLASAKLSELVKAGA